LSSISLQLEKKLLLQLHLQKNPSCNHI
jgi:hypothetical protein